MNSEQEYNPVIQAVLRCKTCGQFLNLYGSDKTRLFSMEYSEDYLYYDFEDAKLNSLTPTAGIISCKCSALSTAQEYISLYVEETDKFEDFFIRLKDSRKVKMERLVGEFRNPKKETYYKALFIEADSYHIIANSVVLPSHKNAPTFRKELNQIRDEILKEKNSVRFSLAETMSTSTLEALEKLKNKMSS